ncbi:MAG: chromosome segregation protein SMC [Candidatus Methylomirabilales bacterium]
MHLSNLTLFGFKSFVDRLTIDFRCGITALVGPNGCGKSNIADAIRWVLGEQSPKSLRGERMEDLIFAGNTHRKPVGMAEVSLTLSGIEGRLAVPYDEVTIARRLYRSGESEYLLNQVPCRLKDITRLFLDTGLGGEPYALIEQGAIGFLLGSRPAERRALLEEAAGIMSYKVNRKTALGRLEAAELNLLRVKDVLQEIERQRNSLHRQAKKAERYQGLAGRLKAVQGLLLLKDDRRLEEELHRIIHQEKQLAEARELLHLRVSQHETSLETGRLQDLDLERRITAAQEGLYTLRSHRERQEVEVRSQEQMVRDLQKRSEEHHAELTALQERLSRLLQNREADGKMRALAEEELEEAIWKLQELSEALTTVEAELLQREEALEGRKGEVLALTGRLVSQRNHVAYLTERQRLLHQEQQALERQIATARAEAESVATRDRGLASQLQGLESQVQVLISEREALQQELMTLQVRQEALGTRRADLREELSGLEGRLHSLQELEAGLEGLSEGQQFLLKGKAGGVEVCQVIEGPLSQFLRVPAAWEKAVEALLGDLLQGLLTPTPADAPPLLNYLKQEGNGWATLLPRQAEWLPKNGEPSRLQEALEEALTSLDREVAQRVVGPALRLVEAADDLQPLLHAILGDAVIVHDLPTAFALLRTLPCPARVATADGAVVSSRGPIQGGRPIAPSLLGRRRELEELPVAIAAVMEELKRAESEWEKVQEALSRRREVLSEREGAIKHAEETRREVERSLAEVRTVASRLGSQIELLSSELAGLQKELADLRKAVEEARRGLEEFNRQEASLNQETADLERQVMHLRHRREELNREVAELRIQSTSLQERREALARSMERLEADLTREQERATEARQEEEEARSRQARLTQEISALQNSLRSLRQQEEQEAQVVQVLQAERDQLRETLHGLEEVLKTARRELADIDQQLASVATSRTALSTERSLLQKRVEEEGAWAAGELREHLQGEALSQDPEELQREVEELRHKMAAMGPINMAALEEYEALSERYRFLSDQAEDLTASVTSLKATITDINRTIQRLFAETLISVNAHLNRFWQRLFGGGEAELVLSQGEETEEPGVEIRVRIPGKRTTTLSLLSGGEKALGAIAFLMALWAVRPSPFIVLDEVDAALDDPNVDRFVSLLQELAQTFQFILITHHPRTIEVAGVLYGITMEEPGVSKLISVRLGGRAEQAASPTAS